MSKPTGNEHATLPIPAASTAASMLHAIWDNCGSGPALPTEFVGDGEFGGAFPCANLASASIAAAGLAAAELVEATWGTRPIVRVDRRLACLWFRSSFAPLGWVAPPVWDPIAGDYRTRDGWIKLHTNAAPHRAAALSVLGCAEDPQSVARAVAPWAAEELERAVVREGGAAAQMRSIAEWAQHPQGRSVAGEPLVSRSDGSAMPCPRALEALARPLSGVRVLDLTRVLAGPVATRFLAGLGAEVLRIDPFGWDEPALVAETTLGKRCARLDLKTKAGRAALLELASRADVLVHGYRPTALAGLGLTEEAFELGRPGLVQVTLNAYGWMGPWRERRGYDSLVQMSCGISQAGLDASRSATPIHLPVQALDHATGYILACAAIRGLTRRVRTGVGTRARASLAATARLLTENPSPETTEKALVAVDRDYEPRTELTALGPARRLRPPVAIDGVEFGWATPALGIGSAECRWTDRA